MKVGFILGSPRSGTTILENILNCHPKISEWYEPYYLWRLYFPDRGSEIWSDCYLTERTKKKIRREFGNFTKKAKKPILLDKSPGHVFNLEIIYDIIPEAKWIHVVRDGRDVTLSINKEWDRRRQIVEKKDFVGLFRTALNMLKRQPFWTYRIMAIYYEIRSNASLSPVRYLNKSKWKGMAGWGPRFEGWEEFLQSRSTLEFNAMQWLKSVEAVRKSWDVLPEKNKIEIRYEDLLRFPEETLSNVLNTLGVEPSADFFERIPKLKTDNFGKWAKEFTAEEVKKIKPILAPMIEKLGYARPSDW